MSSPPQPDPAALALLTTYQQQTQATRLQVALYLAAAWKALGSYRRPQIGPFTRDVLPVIVGAQQHMSALTSALLTEQRRMAGFAGRPAAVDRRRVTGSALRNGVPLEDVYARPFHLVWRQLHAAQEARDAHHTWTPSGSSQGRPALPPADYVDQAISAGLARAINLAHTDLQLAKTHTAQLVIAGNPRAVGQRRLLEGPTSCGKCIVAATVIYHSKKLIAIHPGCDCGVAEVHDGADLAQVLNRQTMMLPAAHAAIDAAFGASDLGARRIPGQGDLQYHDVLIEHTDGEIGPVLAIRGQQFTGPAGLAA